MTNKIKLIVGISLPVLVLVFILGSVLIPRLFFKPKFDFLYTVDPVCVNNDYINCRWNYYGQSPWSPYKMVQGKIVKETELPKYTQSRYSDTKIPVDIKVVYPKIYRYSAKNDVFSEISLEDTHKLSLTDGGSAPDGTVVINDYQNSPGFLGEMLWGNTSQRGLYFKNGSASKKIIVQNGSQQDYYYNSNFHLIAWIKI